MPLSHLVFQYALLKLFGGVQGLGGDKLLSHYPLVWPCNKPFSAPNSSLFGLTVHQAQGLALDNSLFLFPLTVNIFLMATMTILWSEPWWWNDNLVSRVERLENIDPGQYTEPQNPTMLKPDYPLSRLSDIWANSLSNFDLSFLLPENFLSNPSSFSINLSLKALIAAAAKLFQSCLTWCDPIDGSPPGCPVPGILQARVLEWGAIAFSRGLHYLLSDNFH